ncbi:MAG: 4-oxalocrotonate tautomerase [Ancylobacter novellus]|uniref:4-oxalocrotonate tautomerase n=1 Tax=Ancylobacter novellus TaxID=921 RepID=A0A2W5KC26_ANCNO|nr:MAG: 4-oxalocrotonate tautomerase [Ancylobacter novellus]
MPMIVVRYATPAAREGVDAEIAALASRLAAETLGKDPAVTAVLVEEADPKTWWVAGVRPAEQGLSAFWLDIKITAGTNVKSETAAFVRATFEGMSGLLGPIHEESYVLVHAVDGDAYGFGGRTQNARWAEALPG